jgi:hypothetical protein
MCYSSESIDFIRRALRTTLMAISCSNVPIRALELRVGQKNTPGEIALNPDMPDFDRPVLHFLRARPIRITRLHLTIDPNTDSPDLDSGAHKLVRFLKLFPCLRRLELEFLPMDQHEGFPELSRILRLPNLRYLSLSHLECTKEELDALLVRHRATLEEVHLDSVNLQEDSFERPNNVWRPFLATVRDRLSLRSLTLENCRMEIEWLYWCDKALGEDERRLRRRAKFEIGGAGLDWKDALDGLETTHNW